MWLGGRQLRIAHAWRADDERLNKVFAPITINNTIIIVLLLVVLIVIL